MEVQNNTYYVVQSEGNISSESGNTNLYAKVSAFEGKDTDESINITVASVRQEFPRYGVGAELAYGEFFEGDKGLRLDLSRDLGVADVSAYVKYVDSDDIEGGLKLVLPLTPRKNFKRGALVVGGNDQWSYSQGTSIKDPLVSGGNPIRLNKLQDPLQSKTLKGSYLEGGRLSPAYLKANIYRFREAYINLRK
jgi:hypothetical protein